MELTFTRVDVDKTLAACEAQNLSPHVVIPRNSGEDWCILESAIGLTRPPKWTFARTESQIAIPLVAYQTQDAPDLALAYLFALGTTLSQEHLGGRSIKRLHLVIGGQVSEIPPEERVDPKYALRYFMGVGFTLNR